MQSPASSDDALVVKAEAAGETGAAGQAAKVAGVGGGPHTHLGPRSIALPGHRGDVPAKPIELSHQAKR